MMTQSSIRSNATRLRDRNTVRSRDRRKNRSRDQNESCSREEDPNYVHINICGMIFVTSEKTLEKFPDTLLGNSDRRRHFFIPNKNFYFFDRHRKSFEAIFSFYQSNGILIHPDDIAPALFEEELFFFGIRKRKYSGSDDSEKDEADNLEPSNNWRRQLWKLLEVPDSSLGARLIAFSSVSVITLSVTITCMETMPRFNAYVDDENINHHTEPWFSLELVCISCFALEYFMRLIASPNKKVFFTSLLNFIDLTAFIPYFVILAISDEQIVPIAILRIVRTARILQIFKLYRHSCRLQVLARTLSESRRELLMLIFFLLVGVVFFSSAMYYAEHGHNEHIKSIPNSFFYVLITMTTVGYGEVVPVTPQGKIIGILCVILGVLAIAVPVPIIVSTFKYIYKRERRDGAILL